MNKQKTAHKFLKLTFTPVVSGGLLQRACACGQHSSNDGQCEACKNKQQRLFQRAAVNGSASYHVPPIVYDVLNSPSQPLDLQTRAFMEPRFGHDFSRVRIHTDTKAGESARAVNALASTVGQDVVFGEGQYAPTHLVGQRLLAHELTHVVQQSAIKPRLQESLMLSDAQDTSEVEADAIAGMITAPQNASDKITAHSKTALTVPRALLTRQQSWLVQRAINTRCFAPSAILTPAAAAGFGIIAEKFVQFDYCTLMGCPGGEQYFDNSFAGPIDPFYIAFIVRKNPGLPSWAIVALSSLSVNRPDILAHTPMRQDFYEVKPDSGTGRAAGRIKIAAIDGYMRAFSLPYSAGTAYTPTALIPIFTTTVSGTPVEAYLGLRRARNGLIVYELCVRTDWAKVALAALIAVLILIIIILSRGRIPVPGPTPVPVPAVAANQTAESGATGVDTGAGNTDLVRDQGAVG
jgi:hypothetical protein